MLQPVIPIWKQAPFIRLLIPLICGIVLQWYFPLSKTAIFTVTGFCVLLFLLFTGFRGYFLFRYKWVFGLSAMLTLLLLGVVITHKKNITHQQNWFGRWYNDSSFVIAVLKEPLIEKDKSFKAVADIYAVSDNNHVIRTAGRIIIYFRKDSSMVAPLDFGSTVIFRKRLQVIRNTGNPGAFDYQRYCLFQGITHQVYLREGEFTISAVQTGSAFSHGLQKSRKRILEILRRYIHGRREAGVAEALLIGYRDDIDRDMVQAYANTGVIHVIAISGMHLAMIYGLLVVLLKPLRRRQNTKWIAGLLILLVLWLFTLLSGAGPSILRSAVMFSFIVAGESMRKKVSVYHSLSASAFFLLCWNPFFLWDVGFQLSYAAVLSIVIFLRPVSNWFYSRYKIVNKIWKLISVTIAAQILTIPLSVYHFHQIPNLFLMSNLIIVPVSGFVLYGELLLVLLSVFPVAAALFGRFLSGLLHAMNEVVIYINGLPYTVSDQISFSLLQTTLLYFFIIFLCAWLMKPRKPLLLYAFATMFALMFYRLVDFAIRQNQTRIIVYNIPRYSAVDFIAGSSYYFTGDSLREADPFLHNFHLTPSRISHRVSPAPQLPHFYPNAPFFYFNRHRILLLDTIPHWTVPREPLNVDIIILSKNADFQISHLQQFFRCRQYVFDASSPAWKIRQWKNECDSLHLRRHFVGEEGAFVLDL